MEDNFEIIFKIKNKPLVNLKKWKKIKEEVLGKKYNLSVVFVGDLRARKINWAFRKKKYIPNVLSFPLEENLGEIFINWNKIKKESGKWNKKPDDFLLFLYIHSLAHLKGYEHENEEDFLKMEKYEKKIRKKFEVLD